MPSKNYRPYSRKASIPDFVTVLCFSHEFHCSIKEAPSPPPPAVVEIALHGFRLNDLTIKLPMAIPKKSNYLKD